MTPYGHPLMPLLLDFNSAREAMPGVELPRHPRYPGGAERVEWHIQHGLQVFKNAFGTKPAGCWPSEAAISQGTLELLDRAGFRWMASSANVLRASVPTGTPLKPYALAGSSMRCFFRDDDVV